MKYVPGNPVRAMAGCIASLCMVIGAGILWGWGGALFVGGLFFAVDASSDEVVERLTNTTRGDPPRDPVGQAGVQGERS